MHYRKCVLKKATAAIETEKIPDSVIKDMNVLDARTTCLGCNRKLFQTRWFQDLSTSCRNRELSELQVDLKKEHDEIKKDVKFSATSQEGSTTVEDYVNVDTDLITSAPLTYEEIVAFVQPTGSGNASDNEKEADETTCVPIIILPTSAVQAVACLRNFVLQQQKVKICFSTSPALKILLRTLPQAVADSQQ